MEGMFEKVYKRSAVIIHLPIVDPVRHLDLHTRHMYVGRAI
jgi:hypothetical protein